MTRVASHPVERNFMPFYGCQELIPQVRVDGLVLLVAHPAVFLPALGPAFADTIHYISRVSAKDYLAAALEGVQGCDRPHQFHAVVGGVPVAGGQFPFMSLVSKYYPVSSGTRVALGPTIGEGINSVRSLGHICVNAALRVWTD